MEITILNQASTYTLVALKGRFDSHGARDIEADFLAVARSGKPVIVDMAGVECIMSNGMRLLINAAKVLEAAGSGIALVNPARNVRQALELVCLDKLIPMACSLEDALQRMSFNT